MFGDDFDFSGSGAGAGGSTRVEISGHASRRWQERVPSRASPRHLTPQIWRRADYVIAPEADCDEARVAKLSGASDMLLCGKHHPSKTVVATVMYADYDRLRYP